MNQEERYDAVIIGAGQGGKPLATALAKKGWKTAIIERKYVGGTCINYGCTPTKALIASAQMAFEARRAATYGVDTGPVRVDFKAVKARKNRIVDNFRHSIETAFEKTENLTLIYGEARFIGHKMIEVVLNDGDKQTVTSETIVIDCGTSAKTPQLPGLDSVPYLTSKTLLELDELPAHLVVVGGGYISVEFSQMYRRFGSEVTLVVRGKQLLDREDEDIATELTSILEAEGIHIHLNSEVQAVRQAGAYALELTVKTGDSTQLLTGSHLLLAIGITPNTAALNLEAAGIVVDEQGFISVNDKLETSQPGIYALGDIKGGPAFTHIAYDDFRILEQNLLKGESATITGRQVPYTVFTDPQLGRIGLSEADARKQGRAVKVGRMPMTSVARAIETDHTLGLMKVLVDPETDLIVGAAILGMEGGELMSMLQIAMLGDLPYPRLRDAIFAHPTLAESLNNLFSKLE
ncbi:mercuric reductase [Fibrella sp. HMF5335]|uniref:Mercuric reductase n=1 Tax=Fibrella rubiginis TaxID=2817060 RepID=A0A939K3W7_9BACT|nr:mercuric reductase [Fibrella rubiginis]MBO0935561.1 mercuric reductase [Fibrella rubiginis]